MKEQIILFFKGMAMGAADVVPGVSGGTVAFITGIYGQLLDSLHRLGPMALVRWYRNGWSDFWSHVNGPFLLTLFAGILTGIFSLAHFMTYLLSEKPIPTWSMFIGLVVASACWMLQKEMLQKKTVLISLALGLLAGWFVTSTNAAWDLQPQWYIFIPVGALAVCAMILPGISGSFILLLLGMYQPVMAAVKSFDIPILLAVASGCVIGLLIFSRLLNWLLANYKTITVAFLTGLMLGSVNRLWPWKSALNGPQGVEAGYAAGGQNISPFAFEQLHGEAQILTALAAMASGFCIVYLIHWLGRREVTSP